MANCDEQIRIVRDSEQVNGFYQAVRITQVQSNETEKNRLKEKLNQLKNRLDEKKENQRKLSFWLIKTEQDVKSMKNRVQNKTNPFGPKVPLIQARDMTVFESLYYIVMKNGVDFGYQIMYSWIRTY